MSGTTMAIPVHVECYAGYRGAETPRRWIGAGRTIEVMEVVARWQEPDRRSFKVRGDDGVLYLLHCCGEGERWEVEPVD
jgi:hypothetical protein